MRNLKRALSLALASVMLLGMMVVGTSAASFPDVDGNDNIEAIDVLETVEVMIGNENGDFEPDKNVTRAEMAVVMAKLLNLDYKYYETTCPFNDVPDWAKGWVGACAANGIVSGRGEGVYDPNATVTAVEAASMMMRALGYFQYPSDYEGGFEASTVKQASKISLFTGIDGNARDPMNRNQVAKLALNTLESTIVDVKKTSSDVTIGSGDTAVNIAGQVEYNVRVSSDPKFCQAISGAEAGGGVTGLTGYTVELGEQLYQGDLKKQSRYDEFGAPATRWVYKNTEIGMYADTSELTYTEAVKIKDIYKDLGLSSDIAKENVKFWIDGVVEAGSGIQSNGDSPLFLGDVRLTDAAGDGDAEIGGKGTLTRVYYDESASTDKVVVSVVNYYLVKAEEDYDSVNKELDVEVKSDVSMNDTLKLDDFPVISSVKEGDYLVVTVANEKIKTAALAESVMDVQVSSARSGDYVTAGEKYEYNSVAAKVGSGALGESELMNAANKYSLNDKGYNLYLDPYGYVLGVEAADDKANVGDYLFIKDKTSSGFNVIAKALFTDGTTKTITVDKVGDDDATTTNVVEEKFYTFKTDKDGNYELTTVTAQGYKASARLDDKAQPIRNAANTAAEVAKSANDSTVFIAKDKAYTGVRNAPETPAGKVWYVLDENDRLLIVYAAEKGVNSASSDDIVYILSDKPTIMKDGDDTYYMYQAVVNGEKTTEFATVSNTWDVGLYAVKTYTDDRADTKVKVDAKHTSEELATYAGVVSSGECTNGTLNLSSGSYLLGDDAKIRSIDGTTVKNVSASGVKNAVDKYLFKEVYVIKTSDTDETLTLVYLVKVGGSKIASDSTPEEIQNALNDAKKDGGDGKISIESPNLGSGANGTTVPKGTELTITGAAQGKVTSEAASGSDAAGKIVMDNVAVVAGQTLDLSAAGDVEFKGETEIPAGSTLKLSATQSTMPELKGNGTVDLAGDMTDGWSEDEQAAFENIMKNNSVSKEATTTNATVTVDATKTLKFSTDNSSARIPGFGNTDFSTTDVQIIELTIPVAAGNAVKGKKDATEMKFGAAENTVFEVQAGHVENGKITFTVIVPVDVNAITYRVYADKATAEGDSGYSSGTLFTFNISHTAT